MTVCTEWEETGEYLQMEATCRRYVYNFIFTPWSTTSCWYLVKACWLHRLVLNAGLTPLNWQERYGCRNGSPQCRPSRRPRSSKMSHNLFLRVAPACVISSNTKVFFQFRSHLWLHFLHKVASDSKVVYRRYASLFFVCGIGSGDNELVTLEIIHRYVEVLDRYFGNVSMFEALIYWPTWCMLCDRCASLICENILIPQFTRRPTPVSIFNFQKAYAVCTTLICPLS